MGKLKLWGLLGGIGLLGTGCFEPPPESLARLEAVKAEGDALEAKIEKIEDRFLWTQSNVMLWDELARRHKQISAIAVTNQGSHFNEMVRKMEDQAEKARRLKRSRVAQAEGGESTTTVASSTGGSLRKDRRN